MSGCRAALVAALAAWPATAHVLSVSHGTLRPEGDDVLYELRMPLVDVPADDDRESIILDAFHLSAQGRPGNRTEAACSQDPARGLYACRARYRFESPPNRVTVRCDFHKVTVAHHVHVLRSSEGGEGRQTVFDIASPEAEVRFAPPSAFEVWATHTSAGLRHAIASPELLLFLAALALAGRNRREALGCASAFVGAMGLAATAGSVLETVPPQGFQEAAAALTVAYLSAEILFLPEGRLRPVICAGMGCFHGLFLADFLAQTGLHPLFAGSGALALAAAGLLVLIPPRLLWVRKPAEQAVATVLLASGLGWFGLGLIR